MSQVQRQGPDHDHQPLSSRGPLSSSAVGDATAPTAVKKTNLDSRDLVSQHADGYSSSSALRPPTGTRKPTPSPLHLSFLPVSPVQDVGDNPLDRRIDNLPPERESHIVPGLPGPSIVNLRPATGLSGKDPERRPEHGGTIPQEQSDLQSRKMSGPLGSSQPSKSPPRSPVATLPINAGERPGKRTMPRTSSIDSAISSISSASHSHKSSFDSNALTPAAIDNLISAAGSAEAVIVHLLKEKHYAASQNSQLWRLVDKQRTLVLGLNKDLERALKDKERYRKKVKELQSQAPPLPVKPIRSETSSPPNIPPRGNDSHPLVPSRDLVLDQSDNQPSYRDGRNDIQESKVQVPTENLDLTMPSPRRPEPELSGNPSDSLSSRSTTVSHSDVPTYGDSAVRDNEQSSTILGPRELLSASPTELDKIQPASVPQVRAANAVGIKSKPDGRDKMPPANRKPPPAPLNLGKPHGPSLPHVEGSLGDSESDYDGSMEVDEIPIVERGRRRTREDDDKEREVALMKEKEARSRSKKKAKSVQANDPSSKSLPQPGPVGLPSSPRQMVPQVPPGTAHLSPPEPLMSILNTRASEAPSLGERLAVAPPLMSPGLPMSPRPGDRPIGSPLPRLPRDGSGFIASPPTSPLGLPSSPRASKPATSFLSHPPRVVASQATTIPTLMHSESSPRAIPSIDAAIQIDSPPHSPREFSRGIFRGLISDDHPDLLLPPNALPSIEVRVASSRLRPSRNSFLGPKPSDEEPVFTLSVFSRSDKSELWRVEKVIMSLPQLDNQLRTLSDLPLKLPERSIFSGHSPAKVDARRAALNAYFDTLLDIPLDEAAALVICRFLTSDAIEPRDDETCLLKSSGKVSPELLRGPDGKPRKEGYLTKKGKNFGGWKARYFVLHGPELKYFESPGGPHLGTIRIQNAQIGKQSPNGPNPSPSRNDDDSDNQFRHAILILEPKRKDSSALVRHVLCAESDEERDAWIESLLQYVENQTSEEEKLSLRKHAGQTQGRQIPGSSTKARLFASSHKRNNNNKGTESPDMDPPDIIQTFSYDDAVAAEPPVYGPAYETDGAKGPGRSGSQSESVSEYGPSTSHGSKTISGPTNGTVIQDAGTWGNKITSGKEKKRSLWSFRARSSSDLASQTQGNYDSPAHNHNTSTERRDYIRAVFGLPLGEAVQFCPPQGVDVDLPAVVYRCIEYLRAKGAAFEEGIFRLSGSNLVIKALKERFNTEGDVDFLAGDHYYDVHAVASLFKQYLRELPTTVLTRELHLDFLRVLGEYAPGVQFKVGLR